jgi:hypothetical protein
LCQEIVDWLLEEKAIYTNIFASSILLRPGIIHSHLSAALMEQGGKVAVDI